jgi:hypothetical protein
LTPQVVLQENRQRKDRFSPFAGMVDPRTRRQIPGPPEDKEVIFVELRYAMEGRPQRIAFTPPLNESGVATATIGFLLYHKAAPVVDFRYLSRTETLVLEWDDPWFTAFENRNLVRHHRWPQMTFLYIEPREVRHESLVRVRDLMEWTQENPDVHRLLTDDEQARLKQAAGDFFLARNPVTIDGTPANRSAYRAEFLDITPRGLQTMDAGARVDASAALLGISESYWIDHLPDSASMEWNVFSERVDRVPTNVIDPAGPYPGFLDVRDPTLNWTNFIREWHEPELHAVSAPENGWLSLTGLRMAVLGTLSPEDTEAIVEELLRRMAIAFLERNPDRLTRSLALLVAEPTADEMRSELALVYAIPTTGGGVASITALGAPTIEEINASESHDGFTVLASWQAEAKGQHWGHVDQRRIRFRAMLDIGEVDNCWKLFELTVLEAQTLGN